MQVWQFCGSDKVFTPHPTRCLGIDTKCDADASYLVYEGLTCKFYKSDEAFTPHPARYSTR